MREPFSDILPEHEQLLAAGEAELGITTGPLAGLSEMLALLSPVLSLVLLIQLHGVGAKIAGAMLPPLVMIMLARWPLRRWKRPREWLGVTPRRALIWRRAGRMRAEPRIEEVDLTGVVGVE